MKYQPDPEEVLRWACYEQLEKCIDLYHDYSQLTNIQEVIYLVLTWLHEQERLPESVLGRMHIFELRKRQAISNEELDARIQEGIIYYWNLGDTIGWFCGYKGPRDVRSSDPHAKVVRELLLLVASGSLLHYEVEDIHHGPWFHLEELLDDAASGLYIPATLICKAIKTVFGKYLKNPDDLDPPAVSDGTT